LKGQPVWDYLDALEREMEQTVRLNPPGIIETIFVGGGTPTVLLPEQLQRLMRMVRAYFPRWSDNVEVTMEANPGTTDADKLQAMREGGVNRISFGVQSFDNGLLAAIGRIHNTDDVYRSIEAARRAGFTNLSIDLIFGLPGQTADMFEHTLDKALELDLPHTSIYSLKVEENTLFHTLYERNELMLPDEDEELDMFLRAIRRYRDAGYDHYEISNFAKPGYRSRHNMTYWKNESYYGIGAGAHGYAAGWRHVNIKGVTPYIQAARERLPRLESYEVSRDEAMETFMMVGLRMLDGVAKRDFHAQFGVGMDEVFAEPIRSSLEKGLLEPTLDGYRLTERGLLYGNEVFASFLILT
jgi:oxygen-independent coproporphyrinogen-3 oxidase